MSWFSPSTSPIGRFGVLSLLLLLSGCQTRVNSATVLWLLWLVPLAAIFFIYAARRKRMLLARFASDELLSRLTQRLSRTRQALKAALQIAAIAAIVVALSGFQYGFTWEEVKRQGVDIVVAIDVSDSMLVADADRGGDLTRLERAKREISDLLDLLDGDRIALVAFAGTAFLECPLTTDYSAAHLFLDEIDTDLIPVKGTSISSALEVSIEAFSESNRESRAIILITDGEDHEGEVMQRASDAVAQGIRVFPIGIGRDEGAPIPLAGGGFRRDRAGEMVLSRLDETTLQRLALDTKGRYVRSVTGDIDLEQIYSRGIKASLDEQQFESRRRRRWHDRFQWWIAAALTLLMLETLVSERRRSRKGSRSRKGTNNG